MDRGENQTFGEPFFAKIPVIEKAPWSRASFGMTIPEPADDNDEYWVVVERGVGEGSTPQCHECREDALSDWTGVTENAEVCMNCQSNNVRDQWFKGETSTKGEIAIEKEIMLKTAIRICLLYAKSEVWGQIQPYRDGIKEFLIQATLAALDPSNVKNGEGLIKATSYLGGIRMPRHVALQAFNSGKGRSQYVVREVRDVQGSQQQSGFFRRHADYGNVAYHDYLRLLLMIQNLRKSSEPEVRLALNE